MISDTYGWQALHCAKSVQIWSFFCSYIPTFGINTEIYSVNLCVLSKYRKIRNGKNSVCGYFSRSANSQKSICFHKFYQAESFLKKSQIFAVLKKTHG